MTTVVAISVLHSVVVAIFSGVGGLSAPNPCLRGSLCGTKMSAFMVCLKPWTSRQWLRPRATENNPPPKTTICARLEAFSDAAPTGWLYVCTGEVGVP